MEFIVYQAADGWRWRLLSDNHKVMADSGEAYASKGNAKRALKRLARAAALVEEDR